jgi:uncharacterized membrane protein
MRGTRAAIARTQCCKMAQCASLIAPYGLRATGAVLLAVVVALLAAWALSLPAPAQGATAIQSDRHIL